MIEPINWRRIADAIDYYKSLGFYYTEVPWKVSEAACAITCPDFGRMEWSDGLVLPASGEQGFLDLELDSLMPMFTQSPNFVTCTPCFRASDAGRSPVHHPYFMKVELYVRCNDQLQAERIAYELLLKSKRFMNTNNIVTTPDGWDLELNGIEVGSYGARYHEKIGWWAYGTGLAEPRYSQALDNA
jgi:hypothetical protein